MNRFYGFDLGDAESAIARLEWDTQQAPQILAVNGDRSFVTAYARLETGEILIGENACYHASAVKRKIRFKSRYLTDSSSLGDLSAFAGGVLVKLQESGELDAGDEDSCFYIGCPAGWNKQERERYRALFERLQYPPVRIVSESRAALVSACQSKHLQIGYDILSRPVLVVDIGSSTTDFAYIQDGREVEMQTAGEVSLGGGIMDELLLECSVRAMPNEKEIREIFRKSDAWKNYCEFAARRLKERYYSDEEYWKENDCSQTVRIFYDKPQRLTIRMNEQIARTLEEGECERLQNRSFREVFEESLRSAKGNITGAMPELVFLTGGVSKLPAIRRWCESIFTDSIVITGMEPEFAVARGLAWSGRIDEQLRQFRSDLEDLKASDAVEKIVQANISNLYHVAVDTLVDPILKNVVLPVFERWRRGEIDKLADTEEEMQKTVASWLRTDEARELLVKPVTNWMKPVAEALEEYTVPICIRHQVPYRALSLKAYLSLSDIDIQIDAKDIFAVHEITWMIDSIITVIVGLLCGGSGIALISSGPVGIVAGAVLSFLVLFLGKDKMENALLKADIPRALRKLVPKHSLRSRIESVSEIVRKNLYDSFEKNKNDDITERMTDEISQQIEECLTKMAEVVEIPLG